MDSDARELFNHHDPHAIFEDYRDRLYGKLGGPFPFRLAETPLFLTPALRDGLQNAAIEIAGQLSRPETLIDWRKPLSPARFSVTLRSIDTGSIGLKATWKTSDAGVTTNVSSSRAEVFGIASSVSARSA